jgi:drug/metabolite transporter (DMT)-like permease
MNLQPLVGVLLATLILGERLSAVQGLETAAILAGVWLAARHAPRTERLQTEG